MIETPANGGDLTLKTMLVRRARQASDGRLALDVAGGLVVGVLAITFRPPLWPVLASASATFVAFGVWGISDRMIAETVASGGRVDALRALRSASAAFGVVSAVALVVTTMAVMLGTWIS